MNKITFLVLCFVPTMIIVASACAQDYESHAQCQTPLGDHPEIFQGKFLVKDIVDGGTIVLHNNERVKLMGVNIVPLQGERSSLPLLLQRQEKKKKFMRTIAEKTTQFIRWLCHAKRVRLEYDQANAHTNHRDKDGRLIAYVYLEDGTCINAELIKEGYGAPYRRSLYKYLNEFRRLESIAQVEKFVFLHEHDNTN